MSNAVVIRLRHKIRHFILPVQFLKGIKDIFPVNGHILEIAVYTAAMFSREIRIDGTQPFIPHDAFNDHLTQGPLHRRHLIFIIAVPKGFIPDIKPYKVDHLMDGDSQCASLTVFAEHIKASFKQKPWAHRVQADIPRQVIEYTLYISFKSI